MRLALLSDVHGNLEALEAVLADLDRRAPEAPLVCAGDIVGYGADPDACIDRLRARGASCVLGNHEEMVLGQRDFSRCVRAGIVAALWTREHLTAGARGFLRQLPPWRDAGRDLAVCHGDLRSADTYVSTAAAAEAALLQLRRERPGARFLVCGHTHRHMLFSELRGMVSAPTGGTIALPPGERWLVNPGAVGQARSGRPLAHYAVLDLEGATVTFLALEYPYDLTVRKLRRQGLVPKVVLTAPRTALGRRIEHVRTQWARRRAEGQN
jgi:predicted phosphodiesterase